MALSNYYTSTATRQTATSTTDSMGGYTQTWSGSTEIMGRLVNQSYREGIINEQMKTDISFYFYCDASNTLTVTDRLIIDSITYEVVAIQTYQNSKSNHHIKLGLKVVT